MQITEIFYPQNRLEWRDWLEHFHIKKSEIWLQRFVKASKKPSLTYDELVEECLCFGWIDGVVKKNLPDGNVQRITPRRKKTFLSELNRQRIWKLQQLGQMTPAGIAPIADQIGKPDPKLDIPAWIAEQLAADADIWETFQAFPWHYKRLKIGWIQECGPRRREESEKRLRFLIKNTEKGKMYGTIPLLDLEP